MKARYLLILVVVAASFAVLAGKTFAADCFDESVILSPNQSCSTVFEESKDENPNAWFRYANTEIEAGSRGFSLKITGDRTGGGYQTSKTSGSPSFEGCAGTGSAYSKNNGKITATFKNTGQKNLRVKRYLTREPCADMGGGDPVPSGTLRCTRLSSSSIRWRASWNRAPNTTLFRGDRAIHEFGNGDSNGEDVFIETELAIGEEYRGQLRLGSNSDSALLDQATCRTSDDSAPTGSLSCVSSTEDSITIRYTFRGVTSVDITRDGTTIASDLTVSGRNFTDNVSGGEYVYEIFESGADPLDGPLDDITCNTSEPVATRVPYFTTVWGNLKTYGDVHAGGVARLKRTQDCSDITAPKTSVIRGSAGRSRVSTVVSASGEIKAMGAGGLSDPIGSLLKLGNQDPYGGYAYPICQVAISRNEDNDDVNEYAKKANPKHPRLRRKNGSNLFVEVGGERAIRYYGDFDDDNRNACGSGNRRKIIEDLEAAPGTPRNPTGELMIWCDVKAGRPVGRAGTERYNTPFNLKKRDGTPIVIRGRKTLVIQTRHFKTTDCAYFCSNRPDPNYTVVISSNIVYDPTAQTDLKMLPSFAMVSYHNLKIKPAVTELSGYYFAGVVRRNKGALWTCPFRPGNSRNGDLACNSPLKVHGLLSAPKVFLWRTGGGAANTSPTPISEQIGGPEYGLMFVGAAPPGFKLGDLAACGADPGDCDLNFREFEQPPIF